MAPEPPDACREAARPHVLLRQRRIAEVDAQRVADLTGGRFGGLGQQRRDGQAGGVARGPVVRPQRQRLEVPRRRGQRVPLARQLVRVEALPQAAGALLDHQHVLVAAAVGVVAGAGLAQKLRRDREREMPLVGRHRTAVLHDAVAAAVGNGAVALERIAGGHDGARSREVEGHDRPVGGGGGAVHDVDRHAVVALGGLVFAVAPVGGEGHVAAHQRDPRGAVRMRRETRRVVDARVEDRVGREQVAIGQRR